MAIPRARAIDSHREMTTTTTTEDDERRRTTTTDEARMSSHIGARARDDDDGRSMTEETTEARDGVKDRRGGRDGREETNANANANGDDDASASSTPSVLSKITKWGEYESLGTVVRGSRLIPMKTPLAEEYFDARETTHALTLEKMLDAQRAIGKPIGMIIDLSNHDCLYEGEVPADVERVHVRNVAKSVPTTRDVRKAIEAVARFTATDDRFVAIHCAYGFNRTGFIVCCYLIEVCGLTHEEALARFAEARAPGVKHQTFKDALAQRYSDAPDSPEMTRLTAQLFRACSSEPDMSNIESEDNETLDLDINRKFHWSPPPVEDADKAPASAPTAPISASINKPPRSPLSANSAERIG